MNKTKKTIIKVISVLIAIIIVINLGIQAVGQILLPSSKNPYENTSAVSTIAYPYLYHGKPDEIDERLIDMTGERILIYKDKKVKGKKCDIHYTITESNALHEIRYKFDKEQTIIFLDDKLPKSYVRTEYDNKVEYNLNTNSGGEYITAFEDGTVNIEYFV